MKQQIAFILLPLIGLEDFVRSLPTSRWKQYARKYYMKM